MKYPTHLILDLSSTPKHLFSPYWVLKYPYSTNPNRKVNPTTKPSFTKSTLQRTLALLTKNDTLNSLLNFNMYFLRKEKIYTKLKYSRCPQYDMVSGGLAALLAGFIGFLICEKFGLELLDSGDFYIAFMYAVFLTFSLRPFLRITCRTSSLYHFLSPKFLICFYKSVISLTFSAILTNLRALNIDYNFSVFSVWVQKHEYASVLFFKIRATLKFLLNYPKDTKTPINAWQDTIRFWQTYSRYPK